MAGVSAHWRPPRACEEYWSEFRHCRSLWNRFHHYYTFGSAPSCQQWKDDYYSCCAWEKSSNAEAKAQLQQSERERMQRQKTNAPVWELRQKPPADWHLPLPQDTPQDS